MRLFRCKATSELEGERCPRCGERLPEGADECHMCGVDLRPLRRGSLNKKPSDGGSGTG
jgi:ribosomal protein L40E